MLYPTMIARDKIQKERTSLTAEAVTAGPCDTINERQLSMSMLTLGFVRSNVNLDRTLVHV